MSVCVAAFDLDGTLLTGSKTVMPRLASALWRAGHRRDIAIPAFLLAGLAMVCYKLRLTSREGYTRFGSRLIVFWLSRVQPDQANRVMSETAQRLATEVRESTLAELRALQERGFRTVIVSAVIQPFLEKIAEPLGCAAVGSRSVFCSGPAKAALLREWTAGLGEPVDWAASRAYADTLPDLPMLELFGTPVAVAPDPGLRQEAVRRGWRVIEQ